MTYVLGTHSEELERLGRQHQIWQAEAMAGPLYTSDASAESRGVCFRRRTNLQNKRDIILQLLRHSIHMRRTRHRNTI